MKKEIKLNIDLDFCDDIIKTTMQRMRFRIFQMLEKIESNSLDLVEMFYNGKDCDEERPIMLTLPVYDRYGYIKEIFIWEDENGVRSAYFKVVGMGKTKIDLCMLSYKELYELCRFIQYCL